MALNPKRQKFAEEYLVDLNATQAAIRAGYSKKTAGQQGEALLKIPEVRAAVQKAMDGRSKRTNITADYVLGTIVDTIERCQQNIRPVLTMRGDHVTEEDPETGVESKLYQYDAKSVLRGAELLGKHLALFTEKVDHSSTDGSMTPKPALDTSKLSTQALQELMAARESESK